MQFQWNKNHTYIKSFFKCIKYMSQQSHMAHISKVQCILKLRKKTLLLHLNRAWNNT